jgi:hypothetical protein
MLKSLSLCGSHLSAMGAAQVGAREHTRTHANTRALAAQIDKGTQKQEDKLYHYYQTYYFLLF